MAEQVTKFEGTDGGDLRLIIDEKGRLLGHIDADNTSFYHACVNQSGFVLKGDGSPAYSRLICGNRNMPPIYYQSDANTVHNYRIKRVASAQANWSALKLSYAGYTFFGSETAITSDFTLRVGIKYRGRYYPVTFNGSRDYTFAANTATVATSDAVVGLVLPAGAVYQECVRIITTGSNRLICSESQRSLGEWVFKGTDTSVDYTTSDVPGEGAAGYFTISAGTITSLVTTNGGSGYSGSPVAVYACNPDVDLTSGTLIANRAATGGVVNTGTLSSGLVNTTGWSQNAFPAYDNGSLSTGPMYHAFAVTGIPDRPASAMILVGDSNACGYGATDAYGSTDRMYGIYERAFGNRIGMAKLAYPGAAASYWSVATNSPLTRAAIEPYVTHALIQGGGNDIGASVTAGQTIEYLRVTAARYRGMGIRCSYPTPVPRTTGTFASDGGQTTATGFGVGGEIDLLTEAIRKGTQGLEREFPMLEVRSVFESSTAANKWRNDSGTAVTGDGSHPNYYGLNKWAPTVVVPDL